MWLRGGCLSETESVCFDLVLGATIVKVSLNQCITQ